REAWRCAETPQEHAAGDQRERCECASVERSPERQPGEPEERGREAPADPRLAEECEAVGAPPAAERPHDRRTEQQVRAERRRDAERAHPERASRCTKNRNRPAARGAVHWRLGGPPPSRSRNQAGLPPASESSPDSIERGISITHTGYSAWRSDCTSADSVTVSAVRVNRIASAGR